MHMHHLIALFASVSVGLVVYFFIFAIYFRLFQHDEADAGRGTMI